MTVVVSTAKRAFHPERVAVQAELIQWSSAGRFPPSIGLSTKPCLQKVAYYFVLLLLLFIMSTACSSRTRPPVRSWPSAPPCLQNVVCCFVLLLPFIGFTACTRTSQPPLQSSLDC